MLVADKPCLAHTTQDLFIEGGGHGDLGKRGLLATAATLALLSELTVGRHVDIFPTVDASHRGHHVVRTLR
uniref:hypothetical protein n=1 Tax=Candidatus Limnocylindrus sp. TaxID=2802978 RepID=UPI00404A32DC